MASYYASSSVTSGGSGTLGSPWPLQTALTNGSQTSGDTLYLRGGTYYGKFSSALAGGTVMPYPGESVKLDGNLVATLNGAITDTSGTIVLGDASAFPTSSFEIVIDTEVIQIGSRSGNTLSVTFRGATGSESGAQAHSNGANVYLAGSILYVSGSNTTYRDLEITNSGTDRTPAYYVEAKRGNGVFNVGGTNSFINLIIHDVGNGLFTSSNSSNTLIYGVISYNNGLGIYDGGYMCHGFYLENNSGYSRLYESMSINAFSNGATFFGQTGPYVGGDVQGGVFVGAGSPVNAANRLMNYGPNIQQSPTANVTDSHFFHHIGTDGYAVTFGWSSGIDVGSFTNSYIGGGATGFEAANVTTLTFTGNKIHQVTRNVVSAENAYTWNNNTYYNSSSTDPFAFKWGNGTTVTTQNWTDWKSSTGFDSSSTATTANVPDTVIVRPNAYQTGRANIIVYAASNPSSINVDLSTTGLVHGQSYTIKNAFNYFGSDVATGTYNSSSPTVSVPLNGAAATVATPTGYGFTPATTAPNFAAMIVIPGAIISSSLNTSRRRGKPKGTFHR